MSKILVTLSTFAECGSAPLELLEASDHEFVLNPYGRRLVREEIVELGADCDGVVAGVEPYDAWVLEQMPELKVISRAGVGTDAIDKDEAARRGITIRNTPDVVVAPVAELTLAMALDLLKQLTWHTESLKAGRWEKHTGHMLSGSTVSVIGLGRIGRRVAEVFSALGATVLGTDPFADAEWASRAGVEIVPLDDAIARADILTLHLTSEGFSLGAEEIGSMKPGAILLNLARGSYVDEDALYAALDEGRLGGAGLDVFPEEPYSGKLCGLESVVLSPHAATLTIESRLQMETEAVENVLSEL